MAMIDLQCGTHKAMLLCSAIQDGDRKVLLKLLGDVGDSVINELERSNLADAPIDQIGKMFGHHVDAYAFGQG